MSYRVLALDGGGSRALISVALLQHIQEQKADFLASVDLFAGTSTSGITALLLAAADDWDQATDTARTLWVEAKKLYESDSLRTVMAVAGQAAYFDNQALASTVRHLFGEKTIGELKRKIVIPTVVLRAEAEGHGQTHWEPEMIQNFDATFADLPLWEAALRAAAMPILFPVRNNRIDGSLLANNPSLCAAARALQSGETTLDDLRLLSIGAGQNPIGLKAGNADWGYAEWLCDYDSPLVLLQAAAENNSSLVDFQCAQLLESKRYHRLNPPLPKPAVIDEHSPRFLVTAGDIADGADLAPVMSWFDRCGWSDQNQAPKASKPRKRRAASA